MTTLSLAMQPSPSASDPPRLCPRMGLGIWVQMTTPQTGGWARPGRTRDPREGSGTQGRTRASQTVTSSSHGESPAGPARPLPWAEGPVAGGVGGQEPASWTPCVGPQQRLWDRPTFQSVSAGLQQAGSHRGRKGARWGAQEKVVALPEGVAWPPSRTSLWPAGWGSGEGIWLGRNCGSRRCPGRRQCPGRHPSGELAPCHWRPVFTPKVPALSEHKGAPPFCPCC